MATFTDEQAGGPTIQMFLDAIALSPRITRAFVGTLTLERLRKELRRPYTLRAHEDPFAQRAWPEDGAPAPTPGQYMGTLFMVPVYAGDFIEGIRFEERT